MLSKRENWWWFPNFAFLFQSCTGPPDFCRLNSIIDHITSSFSARQLHSNSALPRRCTFTTLQLIKYIVLHVYFLAGIRSNETPLRSPHVNFIPVLERFSGQFSQAKKLYSASPKLHSTFTYLQVELHRSSHLILIKRLTHHLLTSCA